MSAPAHCCLSKRTGLEKAIFQIEEAIKKSKSNTVANENTVQQLKHLLQEARCGLPESVATDEASSPSATFSPGKDAAAQSSDDQLALDDAENPLQLLARASDLHLGTSEQSAHRSVSVASGLNLGREQYDRSDIHRFFFPVQATARRMEDMDPIDCGLVTIEEAKVLLSLCVSVPLVQVCQRLTFQFPRETSSHSVGARSSDSHSPISKRSLAISSYLSTHSICLVRPVDGGSVQEAPDPSQRTGPASHCSTTAIC